MLHTSSMVVVLALSLVAAAFAIGASPSRQDAKPAAPPAPASPLAKDPPAASDKKPVALGFTMKDIDGKDVDLAKYKGKVVMMVNVASKCGYTPQYAELESLYEQFADKGLVILGFPANEFGQQEPGSDSEIKEFCTSKYDVKFPMFSKVVVKGEGICPLYKFLTGADTDSKFAGEIKWNFTKFLISREGKVIARFEPKVTPLSPQMITAIQDALEKPAS